MNRRALGQTTQECLAPLRVGADEPDRAIGGARRARQRVQADELLPQDLGLAGADPSRDLGVLERGREPLERPSRAGIVTCEVHPQERARLHDLSGRPAHWRIAQGSVLDKAYMESLGTFDIVYSWGVLHHTGDNDNN